MKKMLLAGLWLLGGVPALRAGGVFYNSNQSAEYLRTFDRNSAIDDADIVYYNMAGTVRLREGLTLNASNQSLFQRATVATRGNPVLGDRTYASDNPAWFVPNIYGAYRRGSWAFFMGLQTIGATAVRRWRGGLPTLDLLGRQLAGYGGADGVVLAGDAYGNALQGGATAAQAQAAALAAGLDASSFTSSSTLKGASSYFAWRGGAACRVSPKVSLALAGRVVAARQEIVGQVDAQCAYDQNGHDLRQAARLLIHTTDRAAGASGEVGLDLYPTEALVLSFTFEMATPLDFTTTVHDGQDGGGLFVDGARARLDLPMALRFGLGCQATPRLRLSAGCNAYLEKSANFSLLANPGDDIVPRRDYGNTLEASTALEYRATPSWLLSAGVNYNRIGQARRATLDTSIPGAHADYFSLGAGFRWEATPRCRVNLGLGRTRFVSGYENADVQGDQALQARFASQGVAIRPRKAYDKGYLILALGLDYHFSW